MKLLFCLFFLSVIVSFHPLPLKASLSLSFLPLMLLDHVLLFFPWKSCYVNDCFIWTATCVFILISARMCFVIYCVRVTLQEIHCRHACKPVQRISTTQRDCSNYYTQRKTSTLLSPSAGGGKSNNMFISYYLLRLQVAAELTLQAGLSATSIFLIVSWGPTLRSILHLFNCKCLLLLNVANYHFWIKWSSTWTSRRQWIVSPSPGRLTVGIITLCNSRC